MCWCVDVLMRWCVDVLMCWCVDVLMCWCVDVLMCWYIKHNTGTSIRRLKRVFLLSGSVSSWANRRNASGISFVLWWFSGSNGFRYVFMNKVTTSWKTRGDSDVRAIPVNWGTYFVETNITERGNQWKLGTQTEYQNRVSKHTTTWSIFGWCSNRWTKTGNTWSVTLLSLIKTINWPVNITKDCWKENCKQQKPN